MANPLVIALKGKGLSKLMRRAWAISKRYGFTLSKMDHALESFVQVLNDFDCRASFPMTAWALARSKGNWKRYHDQGVEFAIHGYYHVDYSQLSLDQQIEHLREALQVFGDHHLPCRGFRAPYLRYNQDTLLALDELNFSYDSSQAVAWDVVRDMETEAYHRALDFYRARSAETYVSVPRLVVGQELVQIPYSLPDDEALVERLKWRETSKLSDTETRSKIWVEILRRTHELGELFTLGLHPERIALCAHALRAVLRHARALSSEIWIARLDEIAVWWRQRLATTYQVTREGGENYRLRINGPAKVVILARNVLVEAPTTPWTAPYNRILQNEWVFRAKRLPFIGISPNTPEDLATFLGQQGYFIERSGNVGLYAYYLDRKTFEPEDERPLLKELEAGDWPLLRLARWPDGARSALAITGDIDALTLWDYGLRFLIR
jgi:peptidoglycan/xylan/chitin deacetylase (PgdA/CDA1 family)